MSYIDGKTTIQEASYLRTAVKQLACLFFSDQECHDYWTLLPEWRAGSIFYRYKDLAVQYEGKAYRRYNKNSTDIDTAPDNANDIWYEIPESGNVYQLWSSGVSYPKGAYVKHRGGVISGYKLYVSKVDNNTTTPAEGYGSENPWAYVGTWSTNLSDNEIKIPVW